MKVLSSSQWLFYSLEALCISLIVAALFGRQILLKLRWGGSHLKSAYLRPSSSWHSPSWEWLSLWTDKWKGFANAIGIWAVCLFSIVMFAAVPFSNRLGQHPIVKRDWVYFVRAIGTNSYDVLWAQDGYKDPHYIIICHSLGFEPPFDSGEVAKWVQYRELEGCWDMSARPSWDMLRDSDRNLILMGEGEFRQWLQTTKETATP